MSILTIYPPVRCQLSHESRWPQLCLHTTNACFLLQKDASLYPPVEVRDPRNAKITLLLSISSSADLKLTKFKVCFD